MAAARPELIVCDAAGLRDPDAATIDALAYAALTARRLGCRLVLEGCTRELVELIARCGLSDVIACRQPPDGGR